MNRRKTGLGLRLGITSLLMGSFVAVTQAGDSSSTAPQGTSDTSRKFFDSDVKPQEKQNLPGFFSNPESLHLKVDSSDFYNGSVPMVAPPQPVPENGPLSEEYREMRRQKQEWVLQRPDDQMSDEKIHKMFHVNDFKSRDELTDHGKSKENLMQRYFDAADPSHSKDKSTTESVDWSNLANYDQNNDRHADSPFRRKSGNLWESQLKDRDDQRPGSSSVDMFRGTDLNVGQVDSFNSGVEKQREMLRQQEMSKLLGVPFDAGQLQQGGRFGQLNQILPAGAAPEISAAFGIAPVGTLSSPISAPKLPTSVDASGLGHNPGLPGFGNLPTVPTSTSTANLAPEPTQRRYQPLILNTPTQPGVLLLQ